MEYNVSFDYASIVILIYILISTKINNKASNNRNHLFRALSIIALFACVLDILAIQTIFGYYFTWIFNSLYFAFRACITVVYLVYALELDHHWNFVRSRPKRLILIFLPYAILLIIIVINPFTKWLFEIDESLIYHRHKGIAIVYVTSIVYAIIAIYFFLDSRKYYRKGQIVAGIFCCIFQFTGIIVQIFNDKILVEMFSSVISFLILGSFVEQPDNLIEYKTNLPNGGAYLEYVRHNAENKTPFVVSLIHINNYSELFNLYNYNQAKAILADISKNVKNIGYRIDYNSETFYLGQGCFAVCIRNKEKERYKLSKNLKEYLDKEVDDNTGFSFNASICLVSYPKDFDNYNSLVSFSNSFYTIIDLDQSIVEVSKLKNNDYFNIITKLDYLLDEAINKKSFEMFYQPIYDVADNKFSYCEALVRLYTEEFGYIRPDVFIPYAEKTGKIIAVGNIIFDEIFAFMGSNEFKKLGIEKVEINLSISQCSDPNLYEDVKQKIKTHHISTNDFVFEITESEKITENRTILKNIQKMSDLGISFALDDYGTAYSNIARIGQLPINIVKIDKSLIDKIHVERYHIILENTFKMLDELGMDIICEGVEDVDTLNATTSIGADMIQGWYYSKPLPEKEFIDFIIKQKNKS